MEGRRSFDELELEPVEAPYYGIMGARSTKFSNFKYGKKPKTERPPVVGKKIRIRSAPADRN